MSKRKIKLKDLKKLGPASEQPVKSESNRPYFNLAMAVMSHKDPTPALSKIASLPLKERQIWRVISALAWAFGDFDTLSLKADWYTLDKADRKELTDELYLLHRPAQLAVLLNLLFGPDKMERMMMEAIAIAQGKSPIQEIHVEKGEPTGESRKP